MDEWSVSAPWRPARNTHESDSMQSGPGVLPCRFSSHHLSSVWEKSNQMRFPRQPFLQESPTHEKLLIFPTHQRLAILAEHLAATERHLCESEGEANCYKRGIRLLSYLAADKGRSRLREAELTGVHMGKRRTNVQLLVRSFICWSRLAFRPTSKQAEFDHDPTKSLHLTLMH